MELSFFISQLLLCHRFLKHSRKSFSTRVTNENSFVKRLPRNLQNLMQLRCGAFCFSQVTNFQLCAHILVSTTFTCRLRVRTLEVDDGDRISLEIFPHRLVSSFEAKKEKSIKTYRESIYQFIRQPYGRKPIVEKPCTSIYMNSVFTFTSSSSRREKKKVNISPPQIDWNISSTFFPSAPHFSLVSSLKK